MPPLRQHCCLDKGCHVKLSPAKPSASSPLRNPDASGWLARQRLAEAKVRLEPLPERHAWPLSVQQLTQQ